MSVPKRRHRKRAESKLSAFNWGRNKLDVHHRTEPKKKNRAFVTFFCGKHEVAPINNFPPPRVLLRDSDTRSNPAFCVRKMPKKSFIFFPEIGRGCCCIFIMDSSVIRRIIFRIGAAFVTFSISHTQNPTVKKPSFL